MNLFYLPKLLILTVLLLFSPFIVAQTGPGGVGNADGTNGQPRNVLWLDASSLSLSNGDFLTTWSDISGNGNDLLQANTAKAPYYRNNGTDNLNGHPIANFSQADNSIVLNPFNDMPSTGITNFVIYKTSESGDGLISYNTASRDNAFLIFNNANLTTYLNGSANTSGLSFNSGNWQIMAHQWKSSGGNLDVYTNGDRVINTTHASSASIATGGSFALGAEQDNSGGVYTTDPNQDFEGDIAEVLVYNTFLNAAERLLVENYLSEKYNLSFTTASNDKFGNSGAFNTTFIYNIAGIGRVGTDVHTQAASGGLYVYEHNSTLADGEFVMFAHDNTPNNSTTTYTGADLPATVVASWARQWYMESTKTDGIDTKIIFDFKEALSGVKYPGNTANYVLLYRAASTGAYSKVAVAGQALLDADQMYFDVANADLNDGYYTIGTMDQTASPVEGTDSRTWYALASGDWDIWEYWTLDPSGALPNNPDHEIPATYDKVVIHSGKTITLVSNTKTVASITADGILQLGTTTGHNFTEIRGGGRIRLASDNFPTGDKSHFSSAGLGEGTVIWEGGSYTLSNPHTFYNMEVILSDPVNQLHLLSDYTLNGNLIVETGEFYINDNTATTNLNLTVKGNLIVDTNGKILTGNGNDSGTRHQLNLYGDFTNSGTVKFTNRVSQITASDAVDGIVDANFLSSNSDQSILCNGVTNFYRIEIDKGIDATYILDIKASAVANFNLFGYANESHGSIAQLATNNNALGSLTGTVKIGSNVVINTLSNSGNYNISEGARLWVDGGTVYNNNGGATVPYGTIEVSAGLFESKVYSGITTRANGLIKISGGVINTNVIRTSVLGATNVGGYVQSGGTVNIVNPTGSTNNYYHFSMTYPGNVFHMSGGTLHVYDANGTDTNDGGIFIASDPANVNITGGTVIAEIASTTNPFKITSKAPFYNLILRNTNNNTTDHILDAGSNINGNADADLAAQPIVVLNDLTIEDDCFLDHNGQDITIGADFTIAVNSQKQGTNNYGLLYNAAKPNTLTFNGSNDGIFDIAYNTDDGYELYVWNLDINKTNNSEIKLLSGVNKDPTLTSLGAEWHNRILNIQGTIDVIKGTLNQGHQSVRIYADVYVRSNGILGVYEVGVTPLTAYIMLKDDAAGSTDLNTEEGAQLGNFKLNPGNNKVVGILSNTHIKRIGYYSGSLNMRTYNLKLDYFHKNATTNNSTAGADNKMIFSDGNASDGGLSLLITDNLTYLFPIGTMTTSTRYTYAQVTVSGFTDADFDSYITIRPVDSELKTTNLSGGDVLSYYWRVGYEGFATLPTVKYKFKYAVSDDDAGTDDTFYPGKVLDEDPYTRSEEADYTKVNDDSDAGNYTITFNGTGSGFTLEKANYTAGFGGVGGRFDGTVDEFHSNSSYVRWDDPSAWLENQVPTDGSIVHIRVGDRMRSGPTEPKTKIPAVTNFLGSGARVQFYDAGTFNLGEVRGTGMISFDMKIDPTVNGDFGDFASQSGSVYLIYTTAGAGTAYTMNHIPQPAPTVNFESGKYTLDQSGLVINYDLVSGWHNYDIIIAQDVYVKGNYRSGDYDHGGLHFPASGTAVILTVDGDIRVGDPVMVDDPGSASALEHKLIVGGDIIVTDDNIDLFNATDRPSVLLELTGESNNSYTNSAGTVSEFARVVLNKGSDQTYKFSFNNDIDISGTTNGIGVNKAIELQNGTLQFNDPAININLTTGDDDFSIPSSACLQVTQGTIFANGNSGIILDGKIVIDGGILDMSGGDNFIQYSASGNATIDVSSGTLTVGSQIRRGLSSNQGILTYNQSGGTVDIGVSAAGQNKRGIFEILNTGSSFTLSGGTFSIANDYRSNPTTQSFYFNPENVNISTGQIINIGSSNSVNGKTNFTLRAVQPIKNLVLNSSSGNAPKLTLEVEPLTIQENLTIQLDAEFNANALDLNCFGDFTNTGTYTANQNTTYFKGTADQQIDGNTTFYNLTNQNTTNLNLAIGNADIIVDNVFDLQSGTFNDNSNDIEVFGDINNDAIHVYGGSNDGISLLGSIQQVMTGNGTYGKLSIKNSNGIDLPVGNAPTITNFLKLETGIFNIGPNLLTLGINCMIQEASTFSTTNMIQTNVSFTDNGVKKFFPAGAGSFTYPVGSGGKYTPLKVIVTQNTSTTGYLIAKPADEIHPSIINDLETPDPEIVDMDNVLQYYWVLTANGYNDATGTVEFYYNDYDIEVTAPYDVFDYITAKLLNDGSGNWFKEDDVSKFDETNKKIIFNFSNAADIDITGDYTAGVDGSSFNGAIPDQVPLYVSNGSGGVLDWHTASTWVHDAGLPDIPRGARVKILDGDRVTTSSNYISAYTTEILGTVDVGTTFGNRLGNVTGIGILYSERGSLPAGYYETFLSTSGGTLEFGGSTDYSILSNVPEVNNLTFSGTGNREFPNLDLIILGDLLFSDLNASAPDVVNEFDKCIEIRGDITFNAGTFEAGTGSSAKVVMGGSVNQNITGDFTGTNAFNNFEMNNNAGVVLLGNSDIDNNLIFINGQITTTQARMLTLEHTGTGIISGASANNCINGPLRKNILNTSFFDFPIGKAGRYGEITVKSTNSAASEYWETEYYNNNPLDHTPSMNPDAYNSPLEFVSHNEYWRAKSFSSDEAIVVLRWDAASGVSSDETERTFLKVAEWNGSEWDGIATNVNDPAQTISTSSTVALDEHYFTLSSSFAITVKTWEGTISSQWSDDGNWNPTGTPTSSNEILIPDVATNDPIIGIHAVSQKMTLNSGAYLEISPTFSLTLFGDLVMNGDITLKSSASGMASLIDNGTITDETNGYGTATVEQYLAGGKFHYVSSPVSLADTSLYTKINGVQLFDLYFYDEKAVTSDWLDNWTRPYDATPRFGKLKVAQGYANYSDGTKTVALTGGGFNFGDQSIGVQNTDNHSGQTIDNSDGWNLVGNPYPASLDADKFIDANNSLIDGAVYYWDDDLSQGTDFTSTDYSVWNMAGAVGSGSGTAGDNGTIPNGYIATSQAFFVHLSTVGSGTVNFTPSMRSTVNTQFFKRKKKNETQRMYLSVVNESTGVSNQLLLAMNENATDGFDPLYDAVKRKGNPNLAFYSKLNNSDMAIQTLSDPYNWFDQSKTVDLGLDLAANGNYRFVLNSFENWDDFLYVYLEDRQFNTLIDLHKDSDYEFVSTSGIIVNRFKLHFSMIEMNVEDLPRSEAVSIYSIGQNVVVNIDSKELATGVIYVYSITGTLVAQQAFTKQNQVSIPVLMPTNAYLVKVVSDEASGQGKVLIWNE